MTTEIHQGFYEGERSLFATKDAKIYHTVFGEGESPLKESSDLYLEECIFRWKYPLWYCHNVEVQDSTWCDMARAGIWYTHGISMKNTLVEAPKNFRRCTDIRLEKVYFSDAAETLWSCDGIKMQQVTARGDYFAMNSRNMEIDGLQLIGNYSFDGCENVVVRNSRLLSKDAFWNSNHVTVYDSFISGEYLGWNARNLTLVNCTIESLQGMCYIDHLVMKNCKLMNTTLAFEYSTVEAEIDSTIDSVINPSGGTIRAEHIKELILEENRIDPGKTRIICK
jgi:hypothetical protein